MNNSTRNIFIVLIVLFCAAFASAQAAPPLDALVGAIDRNTRAQIRTCEAIHLQNQAAGGSSWHNSEPPESFQWHNAQRCWR